MFGRYVAIGDSQTEGLNDPDGRGGYVGWADRLAARLAEVRPDLGYANLAVRGRVTERIHAEQLAPALAMEPDLVTVMAGVNDLRRPSTPMEHALALIEDMFAQLRATGATVLANTYPDLTGMVPLGRRLSPRLRVLNDGIRAAGARHGVIVVDLEREGRGPDPRLWSADRLHLNPEGHRLLAAAFADTIGLPDAAHWRERPPPPPPVPAVRRAMADAGWMMRYVAPAMVRHARGRSSGDGVTPKRPELAPVAVPLAR